MSARPERNGDSGRRRPRRETPRLGEILVKAGVVDQGTIERVLAQQASKGTGRLGSMLIEQALCTHEQIRAARADGVEVVDLDCREAPHSEVANLLPPGIVRRYEVIPLKRNRDRLWVGMLDPYNLAAIDDIRDRGAGAEPRYHLAELGPAFGVRHLFGCERERH